jgi:hypothetical protein
VELLSSAVRAAMAPSPTVEEPSYWGVKLVLWTVGLLALAVLFAAIISGGYG